jgi:lytic murein transglycosylase
LSLSLMACGTPQQAPLPAQQAAASGAEAASSVEAAASAASLAASAPLAEPLPAAVAPAKASARATAAPIDPQTAQRFADWVAGFRADALAVGINEATVKQAFDNVRLVPRAIELDRAQPEFTRSIWDYIDIIVTPQRVANGQQKLTQFKAEADAASARYGVPAPVLAAVWGIESNFGSSYGDISVFDALATLGFEGRREAWAKRELIQALKILATGDMSRERMVGSWAGAMGHTQFMPSAYVTYAVDGDGDGKRDIWGSMADVMASTANYLARSGWQAHEPWGIEVRLPENFDAARADGSERQSASQWAGEGVAAMGGGPLPDMAEASILLPAGIKGPAFMVGRNYRAILRYNNAMSYALSVGLLSQRIAGGAAVQAAWPREQRNLSRAELTALQTALNERGFDCGQPDGQLGPATRQAVRKFQRSQGLPADGFVTPELLKRLQPAP